MELTVDLSKKTAFITGSNSGIGLGVARRLAKMGADIALNSFTNRDEDHELAKSLGEEFGVRCAYFEADLSDGNACRDVVARVAQEMGALDILVNNAGIQHVAPIEDFPSETYERIIAINMNSTFHCSAIAIPIMRKSGWGRVINIASAHGLTASPYKIAYVAAKHGVVGMTKTIGLETARDPITCNAICPGYVLTPLVEAQIPDTMKEYGMSREEVIENVMLARQPSKDFATVEQIGDTCAYLCSSAADQVTGTTISIDGGWTAL